MYKIAILIPSTSFQRDWKNMKDTYLYNLTLVSFLLTYDREHTYKFFIGVDKYDEIYNDEKIKKNFERFISVMKNTEIEFHTFDKIKKGHVTKMWNILFKKAYDENFDYFFQCGDDIKFVTKGWINSSIKKLKENNDIGITGPVNNNNRILTQSFVSRKHMEIFGFYFPEKILNWCCDDWINFVYKPKYFYPLLDKFCLNLGGKPRYRINNNNTFMNNYQVNVFNLRKECQDIVNEDKKILEEKLKLIN